MITEACQTLKRNRERYLANRPTESLIKVLSDVADGWLEMDSKFRKLALEIGPAQTGFLPRNFDARFGTIFSDSLRAKISMLCSCRSLAMQNGLMLWWQRPSSRNKIAHQLPTRRNFNFTSLRAIFRIRTDEHCFWFAHAFGAICKVREPKFVFTAIVRAFDLRGRCKIGPRVWKSPNGAAEMQLWKVFCFLKPIV